MDYTIDDIKKVEKEIRDLRFAIMKAEKISFLKTQRLDRMKTEYYKNKVFSLSELLSGKCDISADDFNSRVDEILKDNGISSSLVAISAPSLMYPQPGISIYLSDTQTDSVRRNIANLIESVKDALPLNDANKPSISLKTPLSEYEGLMIEKDGDSWNLVDGNGDIVLDENCNNLSDMIFNIIPYWINLEKDAEERMKQSY